MSVRRRMARWTAGLMLTATFAVPITAGGGTASAGALLPPGFREQIVYSGLAKPTNIEFSPDGRVFVAERAGIIKVFNDLNDPTPEVFADLSQQVFGGMDRGLIGMALAPGFPADPFVYVSYTVDAPPGGQAPHWNDVCERPFGGDCIVTGRVSRLRVSGSRAVEEQVLLEDWCQQFGSHSVGDVRFGPDGGLYVAGGDGAFYTNPDYGQYNNASNPCGDPGAPMVPPAAEGGALRSQDLRTMGDLVADPVGLSGTVIRINPQTGAAMPGNPLAGSADPNARRIMAYGLRNPFRFTFRPGTTEMYIADVGWKDVEEINRFVPSGTTVPNFGWPCYEGPGRQAGYDAANLSVCEALYRSGGVTAPYFSYQHTGSVVTGDACPIGGSSTTGIAFYPTGVSTYPSAFRGGLFFADYSRECIWAMLPATPGGAPSPSKVQAFATASRPTDLAIGPGSELYYTDLSGTVRRFRYFAGNQPPVAVVAATPTAGRAPLPVSFDASGSLDPDGGVGAALSYAWDFTSDGTVDATSRTASHTYPADGDYTATLRVTDAKGASDTTTVAIQAGADFPTAVIDTPASSLSWAAGQRIEFTGGGLDGQGAPLPASALTWELVLHHCYSFDSCHEHEIAQFDDVAGGSFEAPDHDYPAYVELRLTAELGGRRSTASVPLRPKTVEVTFATVPAGLELTVGAETAVTPFTRTFIAGATATVSAAGLQVPTSQLAHVLFQWSDGGPATHAYTVPAESATLVATYRTCTGTTQARRCVRGPIKKIGPRSWRTPFSAPR